MVTRSQRRCTASSTTDNHHTVIVGIAAVGRLHAVGLDVHQIVGGSIVGSV